LFWDVAGVSGTLQLGFLSQHAGAIFKDLGADAEALKARMVAADARTTKLVQQLPHVDRQVKSYRIASASLSVATQRPHVTCCSCE
jgi:hypothetical protein